jgi:hypothetical protein
VTPSGSVGPTPPVTQTVAVPVFVTPSNNITCGAAGGDQVLCFIHDGERDFSGEAGREHRVDPAWSVQLG